MYLTAARRFFKRRKIIKEGALSGKQIQLFPTELCNLACTGCPYPGVRALKKEQMRRQEIPLEEWDEITTYLYDQGARLFLGMGGEPASFEGIEKIPENISRTPDGIFILSTSGLHMLRDPGLFNRVGEALVSGHGRRVRNGLTISFDSLPSVHPKDSRELKARTGIELADKIKKAFGESIILTANVMVTPDNANQVLEYQTYLENEGVATNLCTQQSQCFGGLPTFKRGDSKLEDLAVEMLRRKKEGGLVVNSATFLSQLSGDIGTENYHCWREPQGSPIIDVAPNGSFRDCNWPVQKNGTNPQIAWHVFASEKMAWEEFWERSKIATSKNCGGCSWSRRDRNIIPMVKANWELTRRAGIPDEQVPALQNIFVQEQLRGMS